MISLLNIFGYLFLAVVGMVLFKEIRSLLGFIKYKKQGIPMRYFPVLGALGYFKSMGKQDERTNFMSLFKHKDDPSKSYDIVGLNNSKSSEPLFYVNSGDLLNDFFKVDSKLSWKENTLGTPDVHSYIYDSDPQRALRKKGILADIFYPQNLKKVTPELVGIIEKHLDKLKVHLQELSSDEDGFVELDMEEVVTQIFIDIIGLVLIGEDTPSIDGRSIIVHLDECFKTGFLSTISLPNALTLGLAMKFNLIPAANKAKKIEKKIKKLIFGIINKRKESEKYKDSVNMINLIIRNNQKLEDEGKSEQKLAPTEILHTIYSMIFGGLDTSKNTTLFSLVQFAKDQELQKRVRDDVNAKIFAKGPQFEYEAYENSPLLLNSINEILRLYSPIWTAFMRVLTKDVKLGPYKISKGAKIAVPYCSMHRKPEIYDQPNSYDSERYENKDQVDKMRKTRFQPFGLGRRACVGKNLADLTLRLLISSLVKRFEFKEASGTAKMVVELVFKLENGRVKVRNIE